MLSKLKRPLLIQVVDDHEMIDIAIQSILEGNNYKFETPARTIKEALEQGQRKNFDLIILDLYLPDGMGEEVVDFYTKSKKCPQILIHSASSDFLLLKRCIQKGAHGAIFKISGSDDFRKAVHMVGVKKVPYFCPRYEQLQTSLDKVLAKKNKSED